MWSRVSHLAPLAAVVIFVALYGAYFCAAGLGDVDAEHLQTPNGGTEFFYRVLWFVSSIATSLGGTAALVMSVRSTARLLTLREQWQVYGSCAACLMVVLFLLRENDMSGGAGAAFAMQIENGLGLTNTDLTVERTMAFAAVAIAMILVNACALILTSMRSLSVSIVAECMSEFRSMLIVTSIFLVVGTLNIAALYHWASHVEVEAALSPKVADALAIGGGGVYSLLLLCIYGPVSFQLNRQLARLIEREVQTGDATAAEQWLVRHGLDSTPAKTAGRYILMAAPMIAGAVIELGLQRFVP